MRLTGTTDFFFSPLQVTTNRHCRHLKQDVAAKQKPRGNKNEFSPLLSGARGRNKAEGMSGCLCIIWQGVMTLYPVDSVYLNPILLCSGHLWWLITCKQSKCTNDTFDVLKEEATICSVHRAYMVWAGGVQVTVEANKWSYTVWMTAAENHSGCCVWSAGFLFRCHHFHITLRCKYEWGMQNNTEWGLGDLCAQLFDECFRLTRSCNISLRQRQFLLVKTSFWIVPELESATREHRRIFLLSKSANKSLYLMC